jgi:hypothetical protein
MMYATAGNLDSFLLNRAHAQVSSTAEEVGDGGSIGGLPKEERIKAFKKRRQSRSEGVGVGVGVGGRGGGEMRGVMMLGLEEVITLFGAIVDGLAFLVRSPFQYDLPSCLIERDIACELHPSLGSEV